MPNIASVLLNTGACRVLIMAHNQNPLSDAEWEESYLSHIRALKSSEGLEGASNLVFAEGQGPNAKQRNTGNAMIAGQQQYHFKVAVITNSMLVRGAVTALSWFNPLIDAYRPEAWQQAFEHVRLGKAHQPRVLESLRKLQSQIGDVGVLNDVTDRLSSELARPARV